MGFVDNNKYIDYHQPYPLRIMVAVSCVFISKRLVDIRFMPVGGNERSAEGQRIIQPCVFLKEVCQKLVVFMHQRSHHFSLLVLCRITVMP